MKDIILKEKLELSIPDFYESRYDSNGILEIFYPKGKFAIIKFIIVDSRDGIEQEELYKNISQKEYLKKIDENKYYNVYSHKLKFNNDILYVTSFEIIFNKYYINIRVNTMDEIMGEDKINLIEHIHNIILTIKEI
jgi:hypothetical protein